MNKCSLESSVILSNREIMHREHFHYFQSNTSMTEHKCACVCVYVHACTHVCVCVYTWLVGGY